MELILRLCVEGGTGSGSDSDAQITWAIGSEAIVKI